MCGHNSAEQDAGRRHVAYSVCSVCMYLVGHMGIPLVSDPDWLYSAAEQKLRLTFLSCCLACSPCLYNARQGLREHKCVGNEGYQRDQGCKKAWQEERPA